MVMMISGFALDKTPLNDVLLRQADENQLPPPFGNLYENARRFPPPGHGIFLGTIIAITANTLNY